LEWSADRRRNLGYLKNISQFPAPYYEILEKMDSQSPIKKKAELKSAK
jgi:hypothetical protein